MKRNHVWIPIVGAALVTAGALLVHRARRCVRALGAASGAGEPTPAPGRNDEAGPLPDRLRALGF